MKPKKQQIMGDEFEEEDYDDEDIFDFTESGD